MAASHQNVDEASSPEVAAVIQMFSPLIKLHSDEQYFPVSIEYLLDNSRLIRRATKEVAMDLHTVSPVVLAQPEYAGNTHFYLEISPDAYAGEAKDQASLLDVPYYIHVDEGSDEYRLQFWFLFNYGMDQPYQSEFMSIFVDRASLKPTHLFYSTNGGLKGKWVKPPGVEWFMGTHPIIYCSPNKHALSPKSRGKDGYDDGLQWFPYRIEVITYLTAWNAFSGNLRDAEEGDTPYHHDAWDEEPEDYLGWSCLLPKV